MEKDILTVKINLAKTGLESCFKPYKVLMLKHAWSSMTKEEPGGSGDIWRKINELLPDGKSISRASIIFASNLFVDLGIWGWKDKTGKGGHHRLYYPLISEAEFWDRLADSVISRINMNSGRKLFIRLHS